VGRFQARGVPVSATSSGASVGIEPWCGDHISGSAQRTSAPLRVVVAARLPAINISAHLMCYGTLIIKLYQCVACMEMHVPAQSKSPR
jgi:hypothetical protein